MGTPRFVAAPAEQMRIVPLDDFTAIYHRRSGITHLVTTPVPELLETLGETPRTLDELRQALAACYELGEGATDALAARLDELVAAGLVQRR